MKKIRPRKLVIALNDDGTVKDGVLVYQIENNGSVDTRKFYTVGIKAGIQIPDMEKIAGDSIKHAGKGEDIDVSTIAVVKRIDDARIIDGGL